MHKGTICNAIAVAIIMTIRIECQVFAHYMIFLPYHTKKGGGGTMPSMARQSSKIR